MNNPILLLFDEHTNPAFTMEFSAFDEQTNFAFAVDSAFDEQTRPTFAVDLEFQRLKT
jgi:hypothetical protein